MNFRLSLLLVSFFLLNFSYNSHARVSILGPSHSAEQRIKHLLGQMTLKQKVGQLCQYAPLGGATGPQGEALDLNDAIVSGIGSVLNITGVQDTLAAQKLAVERSESGIPLLFSYDVIHGYRTIFPVPLAESASWDLEAIELASRVAAREAAAAGIHWTFAPMLDISRDPRWGRVMEGAGEDPYFGQLVASARIRGLQGDGAGGQLGRHDTILACAKHFIGYGLVEGGRDYNSVETSSLNLHTNILPPFQSAVASGVASIMTSFNDLNGYPVSGRGDLLDTLLRQQWGFQGLVVSDWNSIGELVPHGVASDLREATEIAINAGIDVDMESKGYCSHLSELVKAGAVSMERLDQAVARVLRLKFLKGLFDGDPLRFHSYEREHQEILSAENKEAARELVRKSLVLLKNDTKVLPLSKQMERVAVIGPMADNPHDILGEWRAKGNPADSVTLIQGIRSKLSAGSEVLHARGVGFNSNDKSGFDEAYQVAKRADVIIMAIGESAAMSGEAYSRAQIGIPGVQEDLLKRLKPLGKPIVVVLFNGRPLVLTDLVENADTILEAWLPGTQGGNGIADVLFGDYNPAGKLSMSFPYAAGQIPVYYAQKNTGRPYTDPSQRYQSRYIDIPNEPLFPFGFGLSYTEFEYGPLSVDKSRISGSETLKLKVSISNIGPYDGEEVVQLYVRDKQASITRPVKELKGFQKVFIRSGESKQVEFTISRDQLSFIGQNLKLIVEAGKFELMIGPNSSELNVVTMEYMGEGEANVQPAQSSWFFKQIVWIQTLLFS
ncbi:MAG: beta-glucosidase BglX [Oligoflexales bacterium]